MPELSRQLLAVRHWTSPAGTAAWARVVQRWGQAHLLLYDPAADTGPAGEKACTRVYTVPSDLQDLVLRTFDHAPDPISECDPSQGTYWDYLVKTVVPKLVYCGVVGELPWAQEL